MSCSTQPQLACNVGHAQNYNLNQDKLQKNDDEFQKKTKKWWWIWWTMVCFMGFRVFDKAMSGRTLASSIKTTGRCARPGTESWTQESPRKATQNGGDLLDLTRKNGDLTQKTRCNPRTRMLTCMLMVQMSKHMDMQSRRTLFGNSLFEQFGTYFPCYQSAVWSV